MRGGYPVETTVLKRKEIITGIADYELGYDSVVPSTQRHLKAFPSSWRQRDALMLTVAGLPQAVAYMVGIQRQPGRMHVDKRKESLIQLTVFFPTASSGNSYALIGTNCRSLHRCLLEFGKMPFPSTGCRCHYQSFHFTTYLRIQLLSAIFQQP